MPSYTATGITLLARKYKGTERIATFLTRERGKVEAAVSGVGKPGSKLAPAVEPFTLSRLQLSEGRNLDRLTQCEVLEAYYPLRTDLQRLALASYAAELVVQTTEPGRPEPEAFDLLQATMSALVDCQQPELVTWAFALRYLCLSGIGAVVDCCVSCGNDLQDTSPYLAPLGGCVCRDCAGPAAGGVEVSAQSRAAMRTMQSLEPARLDRLRLSPGTLGEVRRLLRRHIRYHLGVDLKSETFLEKMGRAEARASRSDKSNGTTP